ncbi:replication-relaxation family protein [Planococcus sp. CAU13]|uniref:replication-relaxation family protein n=1 Tax=Planococcus sp. CAU13 TaxID=1541197 RepID=UPI00052FE584|nr:replication-relaxation family protein [Planococcus sp. CAU13]
MTNSYTPYPRQNPVLEYLYFSRGSDITQITQAVDGTETALEKRKTNLYAILKRLEERKLVQHKKCMANRWKKERRIYFLTPAGLNEFYRLKKISKGQRWTSYFKPLPHLEYSLYRTHFQNIEHHLMTTDILTMLLTIARHDSLVDVATNLMIATPIVKPDLGFRAKEKDYFVEIDTGSERKKALQIKFERYHNYFEQLQKSGKPLPEAIFFVIPSLDAAPTKQQLQRIESIQSAFLSKCMAFAEQVNLVITSIADFNHTYRIYVNDIERNDIKFFYAKNKQYGFQKESDSLLVNIGNFNQRTVIQYAISIRLHQTKTWIYLKNRLRKYGNNPNELLSFPTRQIEVCHKKDFHVIIPPIKELAVDDLLTMNFHESP